MIRGNKNRVACHIPFTIHGSQNRIVSMPKRMHGTGRIKYNGYQTITSKIRALHGDLGLGSGALGQDSISAQKKGNAQFFHFNFGWKTGH